jgi:hypothetical protein
VAARRQGFQAHRLKARELRHHVGGHVGLKFDAEFRKKLHDAAKLDRGLAPFHVADEHVTDARASRDIIHPEPLGFAGGSNEQTQVTGRFNSYAHAISIDVIASILYILCASINEIDAIASI